MFCSNCGKTLGTDDISCPHCGAVVGDSRFDGHPYTGAQVRTRPGEAVRVPLNHTRTTYMGSDQSDESDIDARTTYRATRGGGVPKYSPKTQEDALFTGDADEYEEYDGDVDLSDFAPGDAYGYQAKAAADAPEATPEDLPDEGDEVYDDMPDAHYFAPDDDNADDGAKDDGADEPPAQAPQRVTRAQRRKAEQAKREEPKDVEELFADDDELDLSELNAREINVQNDTGIDEDVRQHMLRLSEEREINANAVAKDKKKKWFSFGKKRKRDFDEDALDQDVFDLDEDELAQIEAEAAEDAEDAEDADYSDEADAPFDINISDEELLSEDDEFELDPRRKRNAALSNIFKYGIAAALIVGMLVLIIVGLSYLTDKTKPAPIDGVSVSLYDAGIEMMEYRVTDEYVNSMLGMIDGTTSSYTSMLSALTNDLDSLASMLPQSPALYDQRFISALESIQDNINNALSNRALNTLLDGTGAEGTQDAQAQWAIVTDLVNSLKAARNTTHLDAIIKGERISAAGLTTPTPVPSPTPVPYDNLSRGSKGEAVTKLQTRLLELGYLDDVVDGSFGNKTKTAVELFEQQAGLYVDGIADSEMQTRLYAPDAPAKN